MIDKPRQKTIKEKAIGGDAEAQYDLGWMYRHGWGVTKDDKAANKWLKRNRR